MMPNFTQAYLDSSYFMPRGSASHDTQEPPTTEHYHDFEIIHYRPFLYKAALKKRTTTEEE